MIAAIDLSLSIVTGYAATFESAKDKVKVARAIPVFAAARLFLALTNVKLFLPIVWIPYVTVNVVQFFGGLLYSFQDQSRSYSWRNLN